MSIIPAAFGQVTFRYGGTAVNYPAANVLGFVDGASLTAEGYASSFEALWETNVMPVVNAALTLDSVHVKLGPNSTGPSAEVQSGAVGGDTDAAGTPNTAYLISKSTAQGGRRGRGRLYLPGVSEPDVESNGLVNPTKVTAINSAFDTVVTAADTGNFPLVILSSDGLFSPLAITSMVCEGTAATQRRRMRR